MLTQDTGIQILTPWFAFGLYDRFLKWDIMALVSGWELHWSPDAEPHEGRTLFTKRIERIRHREAIR